MTPTQKSKLLLRVSSGMDIDSAAAELGIPISTLDTASKKFTAQLNEAERAGSARLRGRLLTAAITNEDSKYLQDVLDRRAHATANAPITKIERTILGSTKGGEYGKCRHCNKPPFSKPLRSGNGATPGNGVKT